MKTNFLYLMYGISFASIIYGLYGGVSNTNRRWLVLPTAGLVVAFCTLFWLRPAIDESWHRIEIETLRIGLRGTKAQLEEQNALNAAQGEMLQKSRLQLEAQQLAQRQYTDAIRSLTFQILDLRTVLSAKGLVPHSAETIERPPKDATPAALLEYAKTQLLSLYNFETDPAPTRQLLRKAVAFVGVLGREFPDHAPLKSSWTDEAALSSVHPAAELDKLLTELTELRGTSKFLNAVYTEINASLNSIRSKHTGVAVPASRSAVTSFLASEAERQEFVLQTVRDLQNISLAPKFVRDINQRLLEIDRLADGHGRSTSGALIEASSLDQSLDLLGVLDRTIASLKDGSDLTAVRNKLETLRARYQAKGINVLLPEDQRLLIGRTQSTREHTLLYVEGMLDQMTSLDVGRAVPQGVGFAPPSTEPPRPQAAALSGNPSFRLEVVPEGNRPDDGERLVLLDEAGQDGLLFRGGAYLIDDPYTKVIRPLLQLTQQLEQDGKLASLKRIRVRGYADQKNSSNRLYRADVLPDHLRATLSQQLEKSRLAEISDSQYVRNNYLPNLRAHWIARILGQLFPGVVIEVVDGELKEGTVPKLRTVDITLHWRD